MTDSPREKIVEYFKKNLKKGYTVDALKWALIHQGYSRSAVELAVAKLNTDLAKKARLGFHLGAPKNTKLLQN